MDPEVSQLIEHLGSTGPRQFSIWDSVAWESYVERPFASLCHSLEYRDQDKADTLSLSNYLQMVYQGVGHGWLTVVDDTIPAPNFLAYALQRLIPYQLMDYPRPERSALLLRVWNLAEGLVHEPLWLNRYAVARTSVYENLGRLDTHLKQILAPVLSPSPPADWNTDFRLRVIDFKEVESEFVPGDLYLAAPAVLCVQNRIRPTEVLALLLQKPSQASVLGAVGNLPRYVERFQAPDIRTGADSITINGKQVPTPLIQFPRDHLCVASGFVAVSAEDSQRMWLVETR